MQYRALAGFLMILAAPATGTGQDVSWRLPHSRAIEVEVVRTQIRDTPNQPNASDVFFKGATFLRLRTPEYRSAHLVVEVPAAYLIGRVPACVDAYCTSFEQAIVLGNPLLGVSYTLPALPLAIDVAYRFPTMDLPPSERDANDNWERGVDQMAADAALLAVAANAEEALTPHTSSIGAMVSGELDLPRGAWTQLKAGATRVSQQANESYRYQYERNSRTDLRYDVRAGYDLGAWRSGVGLSGQSTVSRSPSVNCEAIFRMQCDNLAQIEVMSSYGVGRWLPTLLVRWPITEYLKRQASWSLALGLVVGF
jgi:hypothetical protein